MRQRSSWLVTILASIAYAWVFYDVQLFANSLLQFFFVAVAIYGFSQWKKNHLRVVQFINTPMSEYARLGLIWLVLFICVYLVLQKYSASDLLVTPLMDAFLATGSLIATYMSAKKWIQNWWLWGFLNSLYIAFYIYQELYLTSFLYLVLLMLCILGWQQWHKNLVTNETI